MTRRLSLPAILLLIFAGLSPALGEEAIADTRESWRVGVAEFTSDSLSGENVYLSSSFPLLIHETLSRIETHTFAGAEAEAYRMVMLGRERDRLMKLRDAALLARDTNFVSGKLPADGTGDSQVDDLVESIAGLESLNLTGIAVSMVKPIEIITTPEGVLLPRVVGSPAAYAESRNLDLLIFGTIVEIESYLFIDIHLYLDAFGELPELKTAFSRERLADGSAGVLNSLSQTALGREWADVSITASIDSAEIYFDGEFKGIGEVILSFVEPGEHHVLIKSTGFEDFASTISLVSGVDERLVAELKQAAADSFIVSTVPSDAQVYARSQWLGITPAEVPKDMLYLQGMVKKEGYQDFLVPVLPKDMDIVSITLMPDKFDRRTIIEDERKGFYKVLAAFILSMPLPIYFFDVTNTLTQSYMAEAQLSPFERNLDEAYRLLDMRQITLSAYIATAFLSAALFIDATIELFEYIDRVQLSTY
jgi:hypothetical protein